MGTEVPEDRWGTRHCHHQNDSCIKIGSDENHFNVSLIVRDSHKSVHKPQPFWKKRRPKADLNQGPSATSLMNASPLAQTRTSSFGLK